MVTRAVPAEPVNPEMNRRRSWCAGAYSLCMHDQQYISNVASLTCCELALRAQRRKPMLLSYMEPVLLSYKARQDLRSSHSGR